MARISPEESAWEIQHLKGLGLVGLERPEQAAESFARANEGSPRPAPSLQLSKLHEREGDLPRASSVLERALEAEPDHVDLLTAAGLVALRSGNGARALSLLGQALSHAPESLPALLGWGSITQDNDEIDAALVKYRVAAGLAPSSPQVYNS